MNLVLSLFPGIGLLDHAFELEGFCVVRGPDVLWGGDVRRFHPPAGRFDGVIGGPPCQTFSSLANLVRANGHEPKFGNLIPEFERCVCEAAPAWFLMENVPQAPQAAIDEYGVRSLMLNNAWLPSGLGDGMGQEQERKRRFTFGLRGGPAPNLLRWIDLAVFVLPKAETVTQWSPDNSPEAKRRQKTVVSRPGLEVVGKLGKKARQALAAERRLQRPVTSNVGGFTDGSPHPASKRAFAVTSSDDGASKRMVRYKLPDACRLQGLPEDFLSDAPFTAEGKLKAVANGVPLPMGRAIAKAVREAIETITPSPEVQA